MSFQIEIKEGHDPSSCFWFRPVKIRNADIVRWEEVEELDDGFSIEEGDVDCFLAYFFCKYFDEELPYNENRYEDGGYAYTGFEWYLTHNFFTYETMNTMLNDISRTAELLESDYDSSALDEVKKKFSIFYLCEQDSEDWLTGNQSAVRRYRHLIVDFYRRFVARMRRMMEAYPSADCISIMGP